jgi:hypothetical protein
VGASVEEGVGSQWDLLDEHARQIDDQYHHVRQLSASVFQQLGSIKSQTQQLFACTAGLQQGQQASGQ